MNISNTALARGAIPYFVCFEQPGKNHTLFNVERGERSLDDSEYRHRRPNSSVGGNWHGDTLVITDLPMNSEGRKVDL